MKIGVLILFCLYSIRKLKTVVVNRFIRFLHDRSQKEHDSFMKFYGDYGIFLKEGIITEPEQMIKVNIWSENI